MVSKVTNKVNRPRLVLWIAIVVITLGVIGATSLPIAQKVKLGLDLKGGFEVLYVAEPLEPGQQVTPEALLETARNLQQRIDKQGTSEPEITPEGDNRIRAKIAGVQNESELRELLKKPSELSFRNSEGKKELLGSDFVPGGATIEFDQTGRPYIGITIKNKEKFKEVTTRLLNQPLAIYLDEEMLSAPIIQAVIPDGKASIEGDYQLDEVKNLVNTINLGALPLKLTEKYSQSVGATLGQKSLETTLWAGIIGSVIVLVFMIWYYRLPGVIAAISLITYTWLLMLAFQLMGVTLTLPGIAAFVLGIGMAVDANIITYERIKDELRSGKTLLSALRAGSKNSFATIMDANITTIIAAAVILFIGSSSVRGFGVILIASIVCSILTNVFYSRWLLSMFVRTNVLLQPKYFGVKGEEIRAL